MTDDELKRLFEEMRQENAATRKENAAAHAETRRLFDAKAEEMKRHFDVTREDVERRFDSLAEAVQMLDEKMERRFTDVDSSIAETQAMIKFSHRELDRRISVLEETVDDLQSRVQRLEKPPH